MSTPEQLAETVREMSAHLADWAADAGFNSVDVDELRAPILAALDALLARLQAAESLLKFVTFQRDGLLCPTCHAPGQCGATVVPACRLLGRAAAAEARVKELEAALRRLRNAVPGIHHGKVLPPYDELEWALALDEASSVLRREATA